MLQLVDLSSWKLAELETAGVRVKRSFGVEIPFFSTSDIWWMPQEYAIELILSLKEAGMPPLNLTAPGAQLLSQTSEEFVQRKVSTLTALQALTHPEEGWWKSAEAKVDLFPSEYRTAKELVRDIEKTELPDSSLLQRSSKRLQIAREYRSFVLDKKVVTTSIYFEIFEDGTSVSVYDGLSAPENELKFVQDFTEEAIANLDMPRGLTVDVAVLRDGTMAVLEYNPAWCSGWYDCDLKQVENTIQASFDDTSAEWSYVPDPYMINRISKRRRLPLAPAFFA